MVRACTEVKVAATALRNRRHRPTLRRLWEGQRSLRRHPITWVSLRRQESCHRHRLSMRVIRRPSTRRCYRGHRPACRLRIRADHHQACPHPYPWVCQLVPGTRVAPQPTAPLQCRRYPLLTRRASRRCSRHTSSARAHRPVRRAHTSACARTYTCPRACALMPYTRARASAKPCTLVVLRGPGCLD